MKLKTLAVSAIGAALLIGAVDHAGAASMMKYKVVDGTSIPKSLTGKPGDPTNGRKLAIHRKKGNCLACHHMPIPEQQFHGDIGPDLAGVASRYSEGELRLRLVDPKVVNEDTIMPAFYKDSGFTATLKSFKGKTIISAQDVEDIIAYLMTLK